MRLDLVDVPLNSQKRAALALLLYRVGKDDQKANIPSNEYEVWMRVADAVMALPR